MRAPETTRLDFLGFGIELMIYGFYVFLFGIAIADLTWRRRTESVHKFFLFTACLLFACGSIHVFTKFRYLYVDLLVNPIPGQLLESGTPALLLADAIVTLNDFFAEVVLIYRCWVVWDHNYLVIIIPTLASLAFVSCAMATIGLFASAPAGSAIIPKAILPLGSAAFGIPLIFNVMVCSLIVGRILYKGRQASQGLRLTNARTPSRRNYVTFAAGIIVESGVLYLVTQLAMTTLFMLHHNGQILMSDISTQIYGIASTLIIVRVNSGRTQYPSTQINRYTGRNTSVQPLSPGVGDSFTLGSKVKDEGSEWKQKNVSVSDSYGDV